jgi:hypothetical protein
MKILLGSSVFLMLVAGGFGAKDFFSDVRNGTLIDYENANNQSSRTARYAFTANDLSSKSALNFTPDLKKAEKTIIGPVELPVQNIDQSAMLFSRGDPGYQYHLPIGNPELFVLRIEDSTQVKDSTREENLEIVNAILATADSLGLK